MRKDTVDANLRLVSMRSNLFSATDCLLILRFTVSMIQTNTLMAPLTISTTGMPGESGQSLI